MTDDEDRIQRIEDDVDELADYVVAEARRNRRAQYVIAVGTIALFIYLLAVIVANA